MRWMIGLALPWLLVAQDTTGSVQGRVLDPTGAAVAGAEVRATRTETGETRKAVSTADGSYTFLDLGIGTYTIAASHTGFKRTMRNGIELHVSERMGLDLTLEVGDVNQEVSVTAVAEQVQTESGDQSSLITGEQVRELQLNGRSFFTL